MSMNERTILLELLVGGFFAVACIRASVPAAPADSFRFNSILRFPGRLERFQRSQWQWAAMVLLTLVLRMQQELPVILEFMVALQFLLFFALPAWSAAEEAPRETK